VIRREAFAFCSVIKVLPRRPPPASRPGASPPRLARSTASHQPADRLLDGG